MDPSGFAGHSVRREFAKAAARVRKPDWMSKRHGHWKSTAPLERYVEGDTRWEDNVTTGLGH